MRKGIAMGLFDRGFDPMRDLQNAADAARKGLGDAAGTAANAAQGAADQAGRAAGDLADKAKEAAQGISNGINGPHRPMDFKYNKEFANVAEAPATHNEVNPVRDIDAKALAAEALKGAAGQAAQTAGELAGKAANAVQGAGSAIGEGVGNVANGAAGVASAAITGAQSAASAVSSRAGEIADGAKQSIERVQEKEPDELELAVIEYNQTFSDLESEGIALYQSRLRSIDLLDLITELVNSIANTPKSFSQDIDEISHKKRNFKESESFAREELSSARKSAAGAGAGVAAGMAVASMAPSAALWVATTFGTASTGTAITTLSGAAATNAAMAWLGGGALAAGGGGMATGSAFLAMAGPIGWSVAGATLLASIALFAKKKHDIAKEKHEELMAVKQNTESIRESLASICSLRSKTDSLREGLSASFMSSCRLHGADYLALSDDERLSLGSLVNNAKALGRLVAERVSVQGGEQK